MVIWLYALEALIAHNWTHVFCCTIFFRNWSLYEFCKQITSCCIEKTAAINVFQFLTWYLPSLLLQAVLHLLYSLVYQIGSSISYIHRLFDGALYDTIYWWAHKCIYTLKSEKLLRVVNKGSFTTTIFQKDKGNPSVQITTQALV